MLGFSKQLHAFCSWFSSQYHTHLCDVSRYSPTLNIIMKFFTDRALESEGITLPRPPEQPCFPVLRPIPQH